MRKPKIGFIADHHCLKVMKQATVLQSMDYEVHCVTSWNRAPEVYNSVSVYSGEDQFRNTVKNLKFDIWQCNNEPSWPTYTVREIHPKAKIVFDYHDSNRWRLNHNRIEHSSEKLSWYDEDVAVMVADGIIVPSEACKKEVKTRTQKPITWLPPAIPLSWYPTFTTGLWGGAVINGGISMAWTYKDGDENIDAWRNYTELVEYLVDHVKVYIYSPSWSKDASDPLHNHYYNLGAHLGKMNITELLKRLGEHTWNIIGNWQKHPSKVWQFAMANKFFEAIAAGVPSVSFGCPEMDRIIEKYDIGIVVKHPDELLERWEEHIEKRKNLYLCRRKLCMENFIDRTIKLYEEVL